ncbi:hypothetical protein ACFENY_002901 [Salmonella enterica]|nr:hypothetical protein [Salmonella enterica]EDK1741325.1 hypothetical protein [Salmonella enterica subsp. enterica serovar Poona]EBT1700870.1 hypothetical protein [Salmonella enterica]EBT2028206.1 hypothetical protein [Salmonella enterica]ECH7391892.1 hypothetical protein [Salmonella enterica]
MEISAEQKKVIYDAALAKWGFDAQVLVAAEECCELAAALNRFLNYRVSAGSVAAEAADVEIMLEQLRHNGLGDLIDQEKATRLARLARRVSVAEVEITPPDAPQIASRVACINDLLWSGSAALGDNWRGAATFFRDAAGQLMVLAQMCIRNAQRQEQRTDDVTDKGEALCSWKSINTPH